MPNRLSPALLVFLGVACGDPGSSSGTQPGENGAPCFEGKCLSNLVCIEGICGASDDSATGSASTTSSGGTSTATTEPDGSTTSGGPTTTTTTGPAAVCGDGVVEAGEACDDGNNVNGDGCNQDCALPGQPQWIDYIAEGDYVNEGNSIAVDGNDDVIVGGRITPDGIHSGGALIGKWSGNGERLWTLHKPGANTTAATFAVAALADGTIYAGGWETVAPDTSSVAWLRALDPDGFETWRVDYQAPLHAASIQGIAVAANGDIVVGGITFTNESASVDAWVGRHSGDGGLLWRTTYNNDELNMEDEAWDLALTPDGDIVIAGRSRTMTHTDYLTQRYSGDGALLWTRWFDFEVTSNLAPGVAVDVQGNIVALGDALYGAVNLVRYGPDGTEGWVYNDLGSADAGVFDDAGNLYVVGKTADEDLSLRVVGPEGTLVWEWTHDEGLRERAYDVALDSLGNILMTGKTTTGLPGASDLIVIKLAPP